MTMTYSFQPILDANTIQPISYPFILFNASFSPFSFEHLFFIKRQALMPLHFQLLGLKALLALILSWPH
jgi:hypothetical protein